MLSKAGNSHVRIGIFPGMNASDGGIFQYSLTALNTIREWKSNGCADEFTIYTDDAGKGATLLREQGWSVKPVSPPTMKRRAAGWVRQMGGDDFVRVLNRFRPQRPFKGNGHFGAVEIKDDHRRWFESNGTELMFYTVSTTLSFEAGAPYVMAIHDLQHRLQPEFPEVSANGEWEAREYLFRNAAVNATLLLAESETGKEDILNFYGEYGVAPDRVKVLPMLPACTLDTRVTDEEQGRVRDKHGLTEDFLFYPAQFWPHKNHKRIVEALGLLKREHNLTIHAAFCGSAAGEIRQLAFNEMLETAAREHVDTQIHCLGYLPDHEVSALYAAAEALIMPTFFGATNIPPLEAWAFGCPVITSGIRGIREQMGDAAILVDPRSAHSIAEGVHRLVTSKETSELLAQKGRARLASYTPADYRRRLIEILEEAKGRLN